MVSTSSFLRVSTQQHWAEEFPTDDDVIFQYFSRHFPVETLDVVVLQSSGFGLQSFSINIALKYLHISTYLRLSGFAYILYTC